MTNVVAFGYRPWSHAENSGINVRDLHLITELARRPDIARILYVSRPVSLAEEVIREIGWQGREGSVVLQGRSYEVRRSTDFGKIFALNSFSSCFLSPLLKGRAWWDEAVSSGRFLDLLANVTSDLDMSERAILSWTPFAPSVFEKIRRNVSVFDVIDNFSVHARIRPSERKACDLGYRKIGQVANHLTTVSRKAARAFDRPRTDPQVIRNGVPRSWMTFSSERPADLNLVTRRHVVGCGGYFFEKFRVDILVKCAIMMPETDFVLLGVILDPRIARAIHGVKNIHFLGFKHYSVLPQYYFHFDAGLILYEMKLENDGDPLKLYEYLAVGTPVVSLPSMGVAQRGGAVSVIEDAEGLARALRETFTLDRSMVRLACREALSDDDFWDRKAAALARLLTEIRDEDGQFEER